MASQIAQDVLKNKWSQLTEAQREDTGMSRREYRNARAKAGHLTPNAHFDRSYNLPDGSTYDSRETGKKHFGKGDYNELLNRGMSREEVDNIIYGEGSDPNNLSAELQMKSPNFQGHTGDIMDYDPLSVGNRGVASGKYDTPKGPEITRSDINALLGEQGGGTAYSAKEINDMIKEKGYSTSEKAQRMLNKRLGAMTDNPPTDITKTPGDNFIDTTPINDTPTTPSPSPSPSPTPTPEVPNTISGQQIDVNKMNDNTYNVDMGSSTVFGNNNIGTDMSVNVFNQGSTGGGMDNFASAATSIGLLENAFDRSQAQFNGYGRSAGASAAANAVTGADQRIANLDYITRNNPGLMSAKADMQALNTFGDIYNPNFSAGMDFQMPEPPEPPKGVDEELIDKFKL